MVSSIYDVTFKELCYGMLVKKKSIISLTHFLDICQIRLDFDSFVIAGPSVSTEALAAGAQMCQDSLILSV